MTDPAGCCLTPRTPTRRRRALGDAVAQRVEGHRFDARRCLLTAGYGGLAVGPFGHAWYLGLDRVARALFTPGSLAFVGGKVCKGFSCVVRLGVLGHVLALLRRAARPRARQEPSSATRSFPAFPPPLPAAPQVLADTAVFGPLHVCGYFTHMILCNGGTWADVRAKLRTDFWPTFSAELAVWPAVQARAGEGRGGRGCGRIGARCIEVWRMPPAPLLPAPGMPRRLPPMHLTCLPPARLPPQPLPTTPCSPPARLSTSSGCAWSTSCWWSTCSPSWVSPLSGWRCRGGTPHSGALLRLAGVGALPCCARSPLLRCTDAQLSCSRTPADASFMSWSRANDGWFARLFPDLAARLGMEAAPAAAAAGSSGGSSGSGGKRQAAIEASSPKAKR